MIISLHLTDLGPFGAGRAITRRPRPASMPGLRASEVLMLVPLAFSGAPATRRVGLMGFWDDESGIDRFLDEDAVGRRFAGGLQARLLPLRASGSWPGLSSDLPTTRAVPHEGPVVVVTLSRIRFSQIPRFLRTSRPAEEVAVADEALIWGTAALRPPVLSTVSIWRSTRDAVAYAYGRHRPAHPDAIAERERKDFNRQAAFIRLAPVRVEGELVGANPFDASTLAPTPEVS